jgi:hypothetical protein
MPLAEIRAVLDLEPTGAAQRITEYWRAVEAEHADRRRLAGLLVDTLNGREVVVDDVATRHLPERTLLCLKRRVDGNEAVFALGKEFIALFRERPIPLLEGIEGAAFLIYHAEVSADSDGPVEMCRPVPADQGDELAARYPELTLRTEPAHDEAFVKLGPALAGC